MLLFFIVYNTDSERFGAPMSRTVHIHKHMPNLALPKLILQVMSGNGLTA